MVINRGNWALWANTPRVSEVKLTFQIFDSILHVLLTLRSFCILIPLRYVTWSQINQICRAHFLGSHFWKLSQVTWSSKCEKHRQHSERTPNCTQTFPNCAAMGMIGTDSQTPRGVWGQHFGAASLHLPCLGKECVWELCSALVSLFWIALDRPILRGRYIKTLGWM